MTQTGTAPDLLERSRAEFERAMQRNIKGLGYFASPAPVLGVTPKDVLIARGTFRLYHYHAITEDVYRVPILLVMATTNRGYIFDLVPGQSLVEFLLKSGFDVFMIDWEVPGPDERDLGFEDYILDFLPSAVARVQHETGEEDISIVGYCFGGVLSLLWSAVHPGPPLKNLVTFTTPIDFTKMEMFQAWSDKRFFDVDRLVATFGQCPAEMLYSAFDLLRTGGRLAGNIRLWDNMWNDEYVKAYRMIDRWSSDMLPLAGRYFAQTTKQLVWDNALFHDRMTVGAHKIDLNAIKAPFLHFVAEHDHIVPYEASKPLISMIGSQDKEEVVLKGGHVSLVGGANAVKRMWPRLAEWLAPRSV